MQFSNLTKKLGLLGTFLALARFTVADCECGYMVKKTDTADPIVLTDLLESDFTTLKNIKKDRDWAVQDWKIDAEASRGDYGRITEPRNAISNPGKDLKTSSEGINGGLPGIDLYVRALEEGAEHVSVGEIDSRRSDMLWGSYRAGLKITGVNGTCGAFFWYLNDTQEIDIEFLSSQLNDTTSPVNLVLHSTDSLENGGDASGTPTFKVIQLPFEADLDVHEYRFDWQPDRVSFYADGKWLTDMTDKKYIPSAPGHLILSHWSNGNGYWSGGPPEVDAVMTVQYVKAYFNTTDPKRTEKYNERCVDPSAPNAVCEIPDQTTPPKFGPGAGNSQPYFFSQDPSNNKTNGQSVHGEVESGRKSDATSILKNGVFGSVAIAMLVSTLAALL